MVIPTHESYQKSVSVNLANWAKRRSRAPKPELVDAALLLLRIDLDPLRPALELLYSDSPRGRPPFDPVRMFRALLLMCLLRRTSITYFAQDLARKPRLAILAGFDPHRTPCVGTFYSFVDRLEDGPFQPKCDHRLRPSDLRKAKRPRNLKQEKAEREAHRKQILEECDSITQQLKDQLLAQAMQSRPEDFLKRMEDSLFTSALIPSARRGLLGDLDRLVVCGDGSALPTGASFAGKTICQCRKQGDYKCPCPRIYADQTANWGWDSYREVFYFGHTFYQHVVSSSGHDLPIHVTIAQASESDFTLSLKSIDRFKKGCKEHGLKFTLRAAVYDAGHDGLGNYEFLLAKGINPVIALNPRRGQQPRPSGTAENVNDQGIPICPAGLAMRRHSLTPNHRIIFNCPVKRPTHKSGKMVWKTHRDECPQTVLCQPLTLMGPTVYVRSDSDPRHYPAIARDSQEYNKLYALRGGCERSNSTKKVTHKLETRPCRSATHYLVRLYLISIAEHARAWLAEDRKAWGDDWEILSDIERINAAVAPK